MIKGVWVEDEPQVYTAYINIICSNITLWPRTKIDISSDAQPWIWAWNTEQIFPVYPFDSALESHSKDSTGFGAFYFDMAQAFVRGSTPPFFPAILPSKGSIGASTDLTRLDGELRHRSNARAWLLHGLLMGATFLVLFPMGTVALRSSTSHAFQLHWILQLFASASFVLGTVVATLLHPEIEHLHQAIGLLICGILGFQAFLGWKHHVVFYPKKRSCQPKKRGHWNARLTRIWYVPPYAHIQGQRQCR